MNLIICHSPFQVLIAKKIISMNVDSFFTFVMIADNDNKKNRKYYNDVVNDCNNISKHFYITYPSFLNLYIKYICITPYLINSLNNIISINYDVIFVANIDKIEIRALLSRMKFKKINTFDDGTANIMYDSFLYNQMSIKRKIMDSFLSILFGVKYTILSIRNKNNKHFTVFDGFDNISKNLEFINIVDIPVVGGNNNIQKEVSVFVGQPFMTMSLLNRVIKKYHLDAYFPHPRENADFIGINKIYTDLIFEDYLRNFIIDNPNIKIFVYSFFSGAAINVCNFPNVEVILLYSPIPELEKYDRLYQLLSNSFKVEYIGFL